MDRFFQIFAALPGGLGLLQTFTWLTDPQGAAEGLGMPLLEGIGRNSQIGDFTAFFFALALLSIVGAVLKHVGWLLAAASLVGGAALFRSLTTLLHGTDFAAQFVVAEVVMTAMLCGSAYWFSRQASGAA